MWIFVWTLFLLILNGVESDDKDLESVDCYSKLVDKNSLQYRVWCDRKTSHQCCWIQEMCWKNYDKKYGPEQCYSHSLLEIGNLAKFSFDKNTTVINPLQSCEILITVLDKTKPLRLNVIGLDDDIRQVWKSASSIQVPHEKDLGFKIKASEECAIPMENCEQISNESKLIKTNCPIKDLKIAKEKARQKCHKLCSQYKEYPVYFWHKEKFGDGKCLFSKDPKMFEYENEDWHYGLCPTTTENHQLMNQIMPLMINSLIQMNQDINDKYAKINAAHQKDHKSNIAFGSASIVAVAVVFIALGSIGLFLYKRRKTSHTSNEIIGRKMNISE